MKEIIIEDHSTEWHRSFEALKSVYSFHFGELVSDIQHVGSTSVPGLAAKPVLDIDLIIQNRSMLEPILNVLAKLGYEYIGDMGIKDREAFKRISSMTPNDGSMREWPPHNLYVCLSDSIALRNHLALRDFLRKNSDKVRQYGELKKRLAAENPYDIDLYIKNKTPFIIEILRALDFDERTLEEIKKANGAA
jgi:GrpB-like predicted nucleotidyltransferase (UPF0157 family)